ncbi:hypothetical protein ACFXDO_26360 [Streptomyces nigra]|uniref:hypothetical protein n=1 Tax=Streptomyces nigra TaxID=1827580 RepID=UPI0036807A46
MSEQFQYLCTRSKVRRFIRETYEDTEEYGINLGPTQQEVADEFFDGDCHTTLRILDDLVRIGYARRILSYGLYRWIPGEVPPKTRADRSSDSAPIRTEVTVRILDYVTREFNEGMAGNHRMLPSTRDVAKACLRGKSPTMLHRANRHLSSLEQGGSIIKIQDPDDDRWHRTYWALPDSGRQIPVAVTVSGLAVSSPQRDVVMVGAHIDHRACDHLPTKYAREKCRWEWQYMDVSDL